MRAMHAFGELLLGLGVQRRLARAEQLLGVLTDHVGDQLAGVLLLAQTHELAQPRLRPALLLAVQPVADLAVHAAEQIRVDPHAGTPFSTSMVTMRAGDRSRGPQQQGPAEAPGGPLALLEPLQGLRVVGHRLGRRDR